MLFDNKGQGYTEYIVIIGGVMLVAGAVIVMFQVIKGLFEDTSGRLEGDPSGW